MEPHLTLHVTGAPPEWLEKLTGLISELGPEAAAAEPADPLPTARAALLLIESVTVDARHLIRLAVEGSGRADGGTFRAQRGDGRLNGATTSLTRTLKSGITKGWWPAEVPRVLTPTGPDKNGWTKTAAYHLDQGLLPAFREAFADYDRRTGNVERPISAATAPTMPTVPATPTVPRQIDERARAALTPALESMTVLVAAVIVHDQATNRVVLLQRSENAKFGQGKWDLPVGKSEPGEPITETAVRELYEETGLVVKPESLKVAHIIHGAWGVEAPNGFLTVVFAAHEWTGEPENREPRKHSQVRWIDVNALPETFVASTARALTRYLTGGQELTLAGWA